MEEIIIHLSSIVKEVTGYIYPNEIELHWGLLVVIYPYITGVITSYSIHYTKLYEASSHNWPSG